MPLLSARRVSAGGTSRPAAPLGRQRVSAGSGSRPAARLGLRRVPAGAASRRAVRLGRCRAWPGAASRSEPSLDGKRFSVDGARLCRRFGSSARHASERLSRRRNSVQPAAHGASADGTSLHSTRRGSARQVGGPNVAEDAKHDRERRGSRVGFRVGFGLVSARIRTKSGIFGWDSGKNQTNQPDLVSEKLITVNWLVLKIPVAPFFSDPRPSTV